MSVRSTVRCGAKKEEETQTCVEIHVLSDGQPQFVIGGRQSETQKQRVVGQLDPFRESAADLGPRVERHRRLDAYWNHGLSTNQHDRFLCRRDLRLRCGFGLGRGRVQIPDVVLVEHGSGIGGMNRIELDSCIGSGLQKDGFSASWMILQVRRHVVHLSLVHKPAGIVGRVLLHLRQRVGIVH